MASFSFSASPRFPVGTVLGLYRPGQATDRTRAPSGSAITFETVAADGTVEFSSLTDDTAYLAGAQVGDRWLYTAIRTDPDPTLVENVEGQEVAVALGSEVDSLLAAIGLPSSKIIKDLPTAAMMSPLPVFGTKATGINRTTVTEAGSTTLVGSSRTAPNYASPRSDTTYRITGAYQYLFGSTSQDMGAAQNTPPSGTPGPSGMVGFYEWELLNARYFEFWMRDVAVPQYLRMWVSKNGGPFMATDTALAPHTISAVGDGLYMLQPVDMGSTADSWRFIVAGQTFTFGGIRVESGATIRFPQYPVERMLDVHDSYSVTASQTYLFPSYPIPMAFELGLLPHVDGVGGTGFRAVSGNGSLFRKYRDRWPYNVAPFFSDTGPVLGLINASINDEEYGLIDDDFDTEVDRTLGLAQATFPAMLLLTSKSMRVNRLDTPAHLAGDEDMNARLEAVAEERNIPVWDPVADGTLTVENTAAYTWTDGKHPTQTPNGGMDALAAGYAAFAYERATLGQRPFSVSQRKPIALGYGTNQAAPGSDKNAALGFPGLDSNGKVGKTQYNASLWTPFRHLYDIPNRLSGTLAAGTYVLDGRGGNPILLGDPGSDLAMIYLAKSDFDMASGWTTQYRVRYFAWVPSSTAPGRSITFGIAPAGALLTDGLSALGTDVGTPLTFTSGQLAYQSKNGGSSGVFTAPSDGYYVVYVTINGGAMAASSIIGVRAVPEVTYS